MTWLHRSLRYTEKLATPDTRVGDLVGDVDPVKIAQRRSLGDPEAIRFGLVPRSSRGIVAFNELPDLAERIHVSLPNVTEERDIQIRGRRASPESGAVATSYLRESGTIDEVPDVCWWVMLGVPR